ncbi:MAG TPA: hypothetical protein VFB66_10920 [Tepidisphaeraceae bacterium]|nr:hypothetical protein [Tepidisphaeraceae bacterium]
MAFLRDWLRRFRERRHVRPWALSAPVVVLLISLPLLRPFRHPGTRATSDDEMARLATTQALVEQKTWEIQDTSFAATGAKVYRDGRFYSDQPPTMALLLAGPYWVLHRWGHTFETNPDVVAYLLTIIGTTLPVAFATGLVYRMGRLFELQRRWRAGLALAVVLGSGLISYATALNSHAPAAALVLASAACLIHVTITNERVHGSIWLIVAGACAALAAAFEPAAVIFVLLFGAVVLALRWTVAQRIGGLLVYLLGAAGPLMLHVSLVQRTTGNVWQGSGLAARHGHGAGAADDAYADAHAVAASDAGATATAPLETEFEPEQVSFWQSFGAGAGRVFAAFFGRHGVVSHFPVVLVGILGVTMVMHRHWPSTTKVLAAGTLVGGLVIILLYAFRARDWSQAMFATRWYVVFLPLTVFWVGVWLRRKHRPVSWVVASALLAFSVTVSILGATGPLPPDGFGNAYTAAGAARNLLRGRHSAEDRDLTDAATLAGATIRGRARE